MLGGPAQPGIGFSIGLNRLAALLTDRTPDFVKQIKVFIAALGERAQDKGIHVTGRQFMARIRKTMLTSTTPRLRKVISNRFRSGMPGGAKQGEPEDSRPIFHPPSPSATVLLAKIAFEAV